MPSASEARPKHPADRASDEASALATEKAAAIARAHELAGNENAAAEFVLTCKFADARFQAAQHIHSKGFLESIAKATRDTDRRVAKLAQQRLDAIRLKESAENEAALCLERVNRLVGEPLILPNQLSEIDRQWQALRGVPQALAQQFEQCRSLLQQRLIEQTALQRTLIELRNEVQKAVGTLENGLSPSSPEAFDDQLDSLSAQFAQVCAAPEAPSLPKHLLSDVETLLSHARKLREKLAQRRAAIAAHDGAYSAWEADPEALSDVEALRRQLRSLPVLDTEDARLFDHRFERLQARIANKRKEVSVEPASKEVSAEPVKVDMAAYRQKLEALEQALNEGALQLAFEHDKELRAAETQALNWRKDEANRLAKARAELSRLKGWARWGGKVSREELIKTAEDLAGNEQDPSELAKKIGSLRSQWKSMDATSGPADKELWTRFDAACTTAYAPVAAHFSALAAARKANQESAQAMLAQVREFRSAEPALAGTNAADWKKIAAFRSRMMQAWREIGPIDRKARKELDQQFAAEMEALSGPLAAVQQEEMRQRETLIAQAANLDPADKKSMTALRQLQQQWQQRAKSLPLDRKDEQALWLRFRAECDAYVARRDSANRQAEDRHLENYRLKSALCDMLESAASAPGERLEGVLNDAAQQWNAIGSVPREDERALEDRYRQAVSALRAKLSMERRAERRNQLGRLHKKLTLCMAAEDATVTRLQSAVPALEEEWIECAPSADKLESVLHARFQAALAAIKSGDAGYAAMLAQNRAELERELLRMEISLGLESPPEWASERLKLQVDALQASLRSGSQPLDCMAMLRKLCEFPAFADAASRARIERLFDRFADSAD